MAKASCGCATADMGCGLQLVNVCEAHKSRVERDAPYEADARDYEQAALWVVCRIIDEQGGSCELCGDPAEPGSEWCAEHGPCDGCGGGAGERHHDCQGECAYCHQQVSVGVPDAHDDDAWVDLALAHRDDCEWVLTRAHRREVAEIYDDHHSEFAADPEAAIAALLSLGLGYESGECDQVIATDLEAAAKAAPRTWAGAEWMAAQVTEICGLGKGSVEVRVIR